MTTHTDASTLWYDPADYQSPYAGNSLPLRQVLQTLVAASLFAPAHQPQVDAMLAGLRVLLPRHSWWPSYHGYLLCLQRRFTEASEQVRGQTHPLAQLVRACCAWAAGQATGAQELEAALRLLEPQAASLTMPIRLLFGAALPNAAEVSVEPAADASSETDPTRVVDALTAREGAP